MMITSNNKENIGLTYSVAHYDHYEKNGDKNYFEEIIDKMILDQVVGMNESFRTAIEGLSRDKKRMSILSLLDKDRKLFMKIKSFVSSEKLSKVEHLKEVILMLREYVKVGDVEKKKFGEVMTDLNLVKHILSRIPEDDFKNPTKTFIDFANGTGVFPLVVIYKLMIGLEKWQPDPELRYKHIIENQIFVSEIQPKNMFLYMCLVDPYDEYELNVYTGSSLDEGFKKHMREVWNKDSFNYGIGNPPFNQMIDMKFVRLSYELCDVTCIVHPSTWLLDEKGKQKKFTETKELVKDHLESVELFNGNGVFKINLFVPCSITYINKKFVGKIKVENKIDDIDGWFSDIYDINKYASEIYISIKNKIQKIAKIDNIWNHRYNDGFYYANIAQHRGNHTKDGKKLYKNDFYTIFTKDDKPSLEKKKHLWYGFDNECECYNFIEYLKTNTSRFILSIYKNNSQVCRGELEIVPWLDFTKEWTDENLFKEFDLTEEEIKFIEKNIPKYY